MSKDWYTMPPELEEQLVKQARKGISYSRRGADGTKKINWRQQSFGFPADPDALAEAIIAKVGEGEVQLDLDGHKFLIRKMKEET